MEFGEIRIIEQSFEVWYLPSSKRSAPCNSRNPRLHPHIQSFPNIQARDQGPRLPPRSSWRGHWRLYRQTSSRGNASSQASNFQGSWTHWTSCSRESLTCHRGDHILRRRGDRIRGHRFGGRHWKSCPRRGFWNLLPHTHVRGGRTQPLTNHYPS